MRFWQDFNHGQKFSDSSKESIDSDIQKGIYRALTRKGKKRTAKRKRKNWEHFVGYTEEDIKQYLENLFQDGMTWDNYGEWHVDHIIPKFYFRYKSVKDNLFKSCWSLQNLQPLWGSENVQKNIVAPPDYKERLNKLPLTEKDREKIIDFYNYFRRFNFFNCLGT